MTICLHNPTSRIPYSCQRYLGNEKSFRRSAGLINSFEISERENLDLLWGCGLYPCSNKTREVLGNLFRSPRDFLRHKLSQKENKSHFISILWMERFQIPYLGFEISIFIIVLREGFNNPSHGNFPLRGYTPAPSASTDEIFLKSYIAKFLYGKGGTPPPLKDSPLPKTDFFCRKRCFSFGPIFIGFFLNGTGVYPPSPLNGQSVAKK